MRTLEVKTLKGYKAFNGDLMCRNMQYEIGKEYEFDGEPIPCNQGFHFCTTIADTYKFYPMSDDTRICEVEAFGVITTDDDVKFCTNKIRIIAEVTEEYLRKANTTKSSSGFCNSGNCNSGNRNSGDWNSGNRNSGDCNSGNRNSGDCNSGNRNSGNRNSGNRNSGNCNSGDCNSGNWNSGNCNSGNRNSGNCNSGDWNSGDWNSGDWNSGNRNSGNCNSGNRNSGNRNSGNRNSGNCNSGDCNSGDWNATNYSSGVFNTEEKKIIMFNEESDWTFEDWNRSNARYILMNMPIPYTTTEFIEDYEMTEEEKAEHPEYATIGGYLKVIHKDGDKQEWWDNLSEKEKNIVKSLPNFDTEIFKEITGISVK